MGPQHTSSHTSPHLLLHLIPPHLSYISRYLPHIPTHFPTPPLIPLPTSFLPSPTPQHIFLLSPHLPSPSQSVAKLPCDEVSVAKLLATFKTPPCQTPLDTVNDSDRQFAHLTLIICTEYRYQYLSIQMKHVR